MLSSPSSIPLNLIKSAYQHARRGNWSSVCRDISRYPNLLDTTDAIADGMGWTFMDYAVFQGRFDAIKRMRQYNPGYMCTNGTVILHHVHQQSWQWVMALVKENVLSVSHAYIVWGRTDFTLLDLALEQGKPHIAKVLRKTHGAVTAEQMREIIARESLFWAATQQDWQTVYNILDKRVVSVDSIDVWFNHEWVLLQYAFAQRNQHAILKLLDHYGASLDEIRSQDYLLYTEMVSYYEMVKEELLLNNQMAALAIAFEGHGKVLNKPKLGPIARPITPGFHSRAKQDDYTGERGLKVLERDFPSKENCRIAFRSKA